MVSDENEYACDMLPYDTALNTIGFEMRKIVWFRRLNILDLIWLYPINDKIKVWRGCHSGIGQCQCELGRVLLGYM